MRDNFSPRTIEILAKRAGNVCSNPECARPTVGAAASHDGYINIGVASHITAAAPGGPRYDSSLTSEQRKHQSNGIWLCQTDGKVVDSDEGHFTVATLREWKRRAEQKSLDAILRPSEPREEAIPASQLEESDHASATAALIASATEDLAAFKRIQGWPANPIELGLKLARGENTKAFDASLLANAIDAFNEIILIAAPGTGKTTTLLQIAESILSLGKSVAIFIPLNEWSLEPHSFLASIAHRNAFLEGGEAQLIEQARQGQLVLLLDGWNELGSPARQRAKSEIQKLQRDYPGIGIIISTRRQALDVPITGPVAQIEPLSDYQQLEIARSLRGAEGEAILDHAWRTPGIRELVSIPLYLTALLAHTRGEKLPTSKEEVLRLFVTEHERDGDTAEVLRRELLGFHAEILRELAVEATRLGTTTLADAQARAATKRVEDRLIAQGQINGLPQPTAVLDLLVSHHLLVRAGGLSFQHQQFQEWYASFEVEDLMRRAAAGDNDSKLSLKLGPLNTRAWEESVFFACERASTADEDGSLAVATAVLETIQIDAMLAAEMINRSAPSVWETVKAQVIEFAEQWHKPETVDRAVKFMITTGKPEFASTIWPLIANENDQIYLGAFRAAYRFRASVLGTDVEQRIASLQEKQRATVTSQIAFEGGFDEMELATGIAVKDDSSKVKIDVIEALDFRRADRFATDILRSAPDEVWTAIARNSYPIGVRDREIAERLENERTRFIDSETDPLRKLNALVESGRQGQHVTDLIVVLIESAEFPAMDQHATWAISDAYRVFPKEVKAALLGRIKAGLPIPHAAEELLRTEDNGIEDGPAAAFVADEGQPISIIPGSLGVLGPEAVGRLIDRLIAMRANLESAVASDNKSADDVRDWIVATQPSSFVRAILQRASTTVPSEIALLADLVSRHGKSMEGEPLQVPDELRTDFNAALIAWGNVLLALDVPDRSDLADLARGITRVSQPEMGTILARMLAKDLALRREAQQVMKAANEKREAVDMAVRRSAVMGNNLLYRRAFSNTGGDDVVELMKSYLPDLGFDGFGVDAAHVLRDLWEKEHRPSDLTKFAFGKDFSQVSGRRTERVSADGSLPSSPYADAIFEVVDHMIRPGASDQEHHHALQLATVALQMPHGDRASTLDTLLRLDQSAREKQALITALVLGGEVVQADIVLDALRASVAELKAKRWFDLEQAWWELGGWLELLPFTDRPMATLDGLDLLEPNWRQPWRLRGVLTALSYAPSPEANDVLRELPRRDSQYLNDHHWIGCMERRSPVNAARTLLEFISEGTLSAVEIRDRWWLSKKLGNAMQEDAELRAAVYRQYELASTENERDLLEAAIAEGADEAGVLVLVHSYAGRSEPYSGSIDAAIRHAVVGERPSQDWVGGRDLFGIAVPSLRQELLRMIEGNSPAAQLAWRCLTRIDELRDEYGPVESEPRHPDIALGRPWPTPILNDA